MLKYLRSIKNNKIRMITEDKKGRSFVTIMIVIAVCALLLRIAIERLIKINITQNGSDASVTLKLISAALENYAKDNHGIFPPELSLLTKTSPPYLERDYTQFPLKGYNFSCSRLEPSSYSCSAVPIKCRLTGNTIHTVTTGGLLVSEECSKKE